jgi:hypothetical protein
MRSPTTILERMFGSQWVAEQKFAQKPSLLLG